MLLCRIPKIAVLMPSMLFPQEVAKYTRNQMRRAFHDAKKAALASVAAAMDKFFEDLRL